ncbi:MULTISPECIES: HAD-IB family hydrolase [unclassified Diaminobutyricimonas]|uniref:HAD family hydrolase n=1 Tax=unclassified Diaminobutyricimonas TaxID=2643261 RepID=UPI0012F52893|nr:MULTISPECIES: HAD-IB family hydrolase [unclassified Diaminobutyricimonas]
MSDATPPSDSPIIAFFDVDNTLMRGASIYHLGKRAFRRGFVTVRDIMMFAWHQARFVAVGENKRHLSTIKDRALELIGGHSEPTLRSLAEEIYERDLSHRLWPETVQLAKEHLAKGHEVWLISATPEIVAQVIAQELGLTGALGTRIESVDGIYTGNLEGPVLHGERKAVVAEELARRKRARLMDCWAYSDSRNDIPLLNLVGNRVVVNPDASLARYAKARSWPVLELKPSSIREARRRVRREARAVRVKPKRR